MQKNRDPLMGIHGTYRDEAGTDREAVVVCTELSWPGNAGPGKPHPWDNPGYGKVHLFVPLEKQEHINDAMSLGLMVKSVGVLRTPQEMKQALQDNRLNRSFTPATSAAQPPAVVDHTTPPAPNTPLVDLDYPSTAPATTSATPAVGEGPTATTTKTENNDGDDELDTGGEPDGEHLPDSAGDGDGERAAEQGTDEAERRDDVADSFEDGADSAGESSGGAAASDDLLASEGPADVEASADDQPDS